MILGSALLLILILSALFALGNNWSNVLSSARNDLVFAERNRAYGAYVIRREHHRVMLIAFFAATGMVAALLFLPKVLMHTAIELPISTHVVEGTLIDIIPPDVPPTAHPPANPTPPTPSNGSGELAPIDSLRTPPDTTAHHVEPTPTPGPVGPVGPTGPGPGPGTIVLKPDTTPHESWETTPPEYPGGLDALYDDLKKIIKYPYIDVTEGREGKVYMSFVVTEEGYITQVKIGRGVSRTIDAESLRAVRALNKRWEPGKYQGKEARVWFSLPISFKLKDQ